jgi:quinol-cytochrome oxidoreductase complex cytochrome b subunit
MTTDIKSKRNPLEGPGAEVAEPLELPYPDDPDSPPRRTLLPVGPDHPAYPVLVGLALFPILLGAGGHHLAEELPDDETHPFYPDHFWPYPIIAVGMLATVGLMAAFVQQNMLLEQSADPRITVIPRPDWYFLFLFQFLKTGNELITALVIPPLILIVLLLWPFIDQSIGPRLARQFGWARWPVPGRNWITGTGWCLFIAWILFFTFWALAGSGFCLPWPFIGVPPIQTICGA